VPTVLLVSPLDGGLDAPLNVAVSATFSEKMDASTLTTATFTLTSGEGAVEVLGTVIAEDRAATFWPAAHLESGTLYTATLTVGVGSAHGVSLAEATVWTFTTGAALAPGQPVELGRAGEYAILAKSGISTVPGSAVTGDLGLSPAAASYITGFSLSADATNVFSTSPQVTGKIYAANYADPTPANLTAAVGDLGTAATDAAGRAPDFVEHGGGALGGMTLAPGVYKWGTGVSVAADLALDGSGTDVWVFQIAQDLVVSSGVRVSLSGGALPENVFWQVSGFVDLGTTAHLEGILLSSTSITLRTGASVNGRLLAQTAVVIDSSTIVAP
jgi:hypothetical protein